MKIIKTASGKKTIKMSKKEWAGIGKKAGWMHKEALLGLDPVTVSLVYIIIGIVVAKTGIDLIKSVSGFVKMVYKAAKSTGKSTKEAAEWIMERVSSSDDEARKVAEEVNALNDGLEVEEDIGVEDLDEGIA